MGVYRKTQLALLSLCMLPTAAQAGAWTRPAGSSLLITTTELSAGTSRFDHRGKLLPTDRFSKFESRSLAESGITNTTTLLVGTRIGRSASLPPDEALTLTNLGSHERVTTFAAGLRQQLWQNDSWSVSAQVLSEFTRAKQQDELGQMLTPTVARRQLEAGLAAGHSFELMGKMAFFQGSAGYRHRSDGFPADILASATFGIRPHPKLLLLAQAFSEIGQRTALVPLPASRLKLKASAVLDFWSKHSLEISGTVTPLGRNSIAERSIGVSLWRKF